MMGRQSRQMAMIFVDIESLMDLLTKAKILLKPTVVPAEQ